MDYVKSYRSFINGRYLSEGIRMTAGILAPALVLSNFNLLELGLVMSVGALCVSATDNPGPIKYRLNGMLLCILIMSVVVVIISYTSFSPLLLALVITVFGFFFSMLTVYGMRTSSIGIAALLVMILNLQTPQHGYQIWNNALYIFCGGSWYMLFSLVLYKLRPYKLIQQILGDCIISTGNYLETRASFYGNNPDYDATYELLLQKQVKIQTQQNLLVELIFKTREIVKESTNTGRILLMIYLEVAELFESVMTTFQQYPILHKEFDATGILEEYKQVIILLAKELEVIGIAVKSARSSKYNNNINDEIKKIKTKFEQLRKDYMKQENVEQFISLGRIRDNMQDLAERIKVLHRYTRYDRKIKKPELSSIDVNDFVEVQDISPSLFFDNLNFKSGVFRHSLRVSLALLTGYLISLFFKIGHSYWILLTIVVLLKPAYSLTKQRNRARLTGTFFGIIIGVIILMLVKNNMALLIIMILFMAGSYIFLRTSYITSVLLMTPYLVIFFHLLYPNNLRIVLTDRFADTAIGSGIAFLASIFLVPAWEHTTIATYMTNILNSANKYFDVVANGFTLKNITVGKEIILARRNTLISLANLSDAFTRMLSEPKRFQKGNELIHRFVVLNYTLVSNIATLSYYLNSRGNNFRSMDLLPVIRATDQHFKNAITTIELPGSEIQMPDKNILRKLNEESEILLEKRKEEISRGMLETETKAALTEVKSVIDQFNYIFNITADISNILQQQKATNQQNIIATK